MPIFKDFSDQGKLLGTRDEPLDDSNVERYLAEYGEERFKGYTDALQDVLKYFEKNISNRPGLKANIFAFWDEKEAFYKKHCLKNLPPDVE